MLTGDGDQDEFNSSRDAILSKSDSCAIRIYQIIAQNNGPSLNHHVTRNSAYHIIGVADDILGTVPSKIETMSLSSQKTPETCHNRPYFLDNSTMSRLKQIISLATCSGTVPWRFNTKSHKIDRWSPSLEKLWRLQWYFITLQTVCLTVYQFYSFISRIKNLQEHSNRELFMASVSVYWYVCAVYFNMNMFIYEDKVIIKYFN